MGVSAVHAGLVGDGWEVNVKRVERLWRREGLRVPPPRSKSSGQKALGHDEHASWMLPATRPGHVWSYDFMSLRTGAGTRLRVLNMVDEFTRVCVGSAVHYSIGATEVRRTMEGIFAVHGGPAIIRSDNGREFIATGLLEWLREQGVDPIQVAKASPQQNGFVERFNGPMRDELLNRETFHSLTEARVLIGNWVEHYNTERPHSGLNMRTPARAPQNPLALSDQVDHFVGSGQSQVKELPQRSVFRLVASASTLWCRDPPSYAAVGGGSGRWWCRPARRALVQFHTQRVQQSTRHPIRQCCHDEFDNLLRRPLPLQLGPHVIRDSVIGIQVIGHL